MLAISLQEVDLKANALIKDAAQQVASSLRPHALVAEGLIH